MGFLHDKNASCHICGSSCICVCDVCGKATCSSHSRSCPHKCIYFKQKGNLMKCAFRKPKARFCWQCKDIVECVRDVCEKCFPQHKIDVHNRYY